MSIALWVESSVNSHLQTECHRKTATLYHGYNTHFDTPPWFLAWCAEQYWRMQLERTSGVTGRQRGAHSGMPLAEVRTWARWRPTLNTSYVIKVKLQRQEHRHRILRL